MNTIYILCTKNLLLVQVFSRNYDSKYASKTIHSMCNNRDLYNFAFNDKSH